MNMIIVDTVFLVVAVLVSILIWLRFSRRIAGIVLVFSFLLVCLVQVDQHLGYAAVLVGIPIALRHSRKIRAVCAAMLLILQLLRPEE